MAMEFQYRLMYLLGIRPWDQRAIPAALTQMIEGAAALPPGQAFDIGCGTGRHAAYLASRGWDVTAIDVSARAIREARQRRADIDWHAVGLGAPSLDPVIERLSSRVTLVLDVGCLHGLDARGRAAWASTVNAVAAPGAHLLLRAAPPRATRSITPRGIDPADVAALLGQQWSRAGRPSPQWTVHLRSAVTGQLAEGR